MVTSCTALLIVDVQTGSFHEKKSLYRGTELLKNIQLLISKARLAQTLIIYMKYNDKPGTPLERGTSGWEIHASIAPLEKDIIFEKNHPDSFHKTKLQQELDARNIKRIVITGIQSEVCIDATCRSAYSLGYDIILVKDGHSTYDSPILSASQIIDHHNHVLGQWFVDVKKADTVEF
ncbi:cysteine hydrolase family protein [Bacillus sp. DX4.1]|uniref:cysteine hydrolase family protein n=1 Tax=Bacillus sp. DX4.1 TaxID=3055867 RepID=UPI0025A223E1|nr:cysteine hydrolase family protein [Bacillus sp. DX4.1]MDM5188130.1 cysteine hydrolase family protein [Bacillus sp. DX4.1]